MAASASVVAQRLSAGLRKIIVGEDEALFALQVALLASGHALVEGVPGTAKTLIVRVLALLLGAQFRRIQFTPDLMPSDVVGTTVFNPKSGEFFTRQGPIFTNLLLADEINRTPPKTQSALLEAMEERHVTIDGVTFQLPPLFMVCATQNPVEYEGTYPLPEAQLDRFMVKCRTSYPSADEETALLERVARGFDSRFLEREGLSAVVTEAEIAAARQDVRAVHVAPSLQQYVYEIVKRTRDAGDVSLGASPRAGIQLLIAAQAAAAIDGRDFATPDDVKATAPLVLNHRLLVRPEAEVEGLTASDVIKRVLDAVPVPKEATAPAT
ncbi:MAG TPA: MoxR family ATPase [Candidatus Binatus sp.]|nr:MoxR family ATPase [Candidatus Binatus sp.]